MILATFNKNANQKGDGFPRSHPLFGFLDYESLQIARGGIRRQSFR
jgi:hypothetical protein